jgi:hypothetical protein
MAERNRQLQHPVEVDPLHIKRLVDAKLDAIGYKETRRDYSLTTDLELTYNGCVEVIGAMNLLIEGSAEDADALRMVVADLRVRLDDLRFHIRSSAPSLLRLQNHAARRSEGES